MLCRKCVVTALVPTVFWRVQVDKFRVHAFERVLFFPSAEGKLKPKYTFGIINKTMASSSPRSPSPCPTKRTRTIETSPIATTGSDTKSDPPDPWVEAPQSKLWDAAKSKWKSHEQGSVPMRLSAEVAAEDWRVTCQELAVYRLLMRRARNHSLMTEEQASRFRVAGVTHSTELTITGPIASTSSSTSSSTTTTTTTSTTTTGSRGARYS